MPARLSSLPQIICWYNVCVSAKFLAYDILLSDDLSGQSPPSLRLSFASPGASNWIAETVPGRAKPCSEIRDANHLANRQIFQAPKKRKSALQGTMCPKRGDPKTRGPIWYMRGNRPKASINSWSFNACHVYPRAASVVTHTHITCVAVVALLLSDAFCFL